jgi:hypothetical protein
MTQAAREVLEDCKIALSSIREGIQGREWRVQWVAAVTLLRIVGHVLDKIDSRRSPAYKQSIDRAWKLLQSTKPNPEIFWGFIDDERNAVLKEYSISAGQGVTIDLSGTHGVATYHYIINSGPFKGQDQRNVISDAIAWWESYLDLIDQSISQGAV